MVRDYLNRAEKRLKILKVLEDEGDYPDVVRESQEVVELLLKALLMEVGLDVPKVHDVSRHLRENLELFPDPIKESMDEIVEISRRLRKERELSFYGALDWIPSEEYTLADARKARSDAERIYELVQKAIS